MIISLRFCGNRISLGKSSEKLGHALRFGFFFHFVFRVWRKMSRETRQENGKGKIQLKMFLVQNIQIAEE
jgi:hypothetical protein